jgi:hypothetical protein
MDGSAYVESGGIAASRRALAIVLSSSLPPARKEAKLAALRIIRLLIHLVLPHADGPPRLQPRLAEHGNTGTLPGERASPDPGD